jgi:hypothetical protein
MFRDEAGNYFRAAGDLSLYFPLAEAAGMHKTCFIPEKLYHYRVHERCNFRRRRSEQLDNNRLIRSRPPLPPQCEWFDFEIRVNKPLKTELRELAEEIRKDHPLPYSVRISCGNGRDDGWDAYSGLWIGEGVFFEVETCSSAARTEKAA